MFRIKQKKLEDILFYFILSGVLILSAGIGLIKFNGKLGSSLIIVGSSLFYVGVVVFAFIVR
jgi:predicted membrane channel-forming protein YqfA (hemolysin III family)